MKPLRISQISKKGMFFTSVVVIIVTILILTFSPPKPLTLAEELPALQAKAQLVNEHAKTVRTGYVPQSLYLASYNALYALGEYMRQSGVGEGYFSTSQIFNLTFKEVVINGTICCDLPGSPVACDDSNLAQVNDPSMHIGVDQCIGQAIMRDKNLSYKLRQIENVSFVALRVNTTFFKNYGNMAVVLFQNNNTGPWQLGVNLTINYSIVAGDVMLNNTENISTVFNIEGIPDPLYAVGSQAAAEDGGTVYTNLFNATNITRWNISNVYRQVEWRLYRYSKNASSFLMRFYGIDERSPCCGVESLINPFVMSSVNGLREKPYVDWCYYGSNNRCTTAQTGALWNVTCVTTDTLPNPPETKFFRFAIDSYHAAEYNITNYLYGAGAPPACPETPFP